MWLGNLQIRVRERMAKASFVDFVVMKVCLIAFTLMVAKISPEILALSWGWYFVVFILTYAYVVVFFFVRK